MIAYSFYSARILYSSSYIIQKKIQIFGQMNKNIPYLWPHVSSLVSWSKNVLVLIGCIIIELYLLVYLENLKVKFY